MTGYRKAWLYAAVTAGLIGLSWWRQSGVSLDSADGILRALRWLLLGGVVLLSSGIFLRRGMDAVFLDTVGGVTLAAALILLLLYGGMENTAAPGADTAANWLLCLWTALPLVFWIRTLVLAFSAREGRGRWVAVAAVTLAIWMAVLLFSGNLLSFQHLSAEETADSTYSLEEGEETP